MNVNSFTSISARTGGSAVPTTAGTCGGFLGLGLLLVSEPLAPLRLRGERRRFQLRGRRLGRTLLAERSQPFKAVNKPGRPRPRAQGFGHGIFAFFRCLLDHTLSSKALPTERPFQGSRAKEALPRLPPTVATVTPSSPK